MGEVKGAEAIERFHVMRSELASIACVLHEHNLATYKSHDQYHYFLMTQEISNTVMVQSTPSGVSLSFPKELSAIVNCEFDYMRIANDAIILGMWSMYKNAGDSREFNIVLPATTMMAQYLKDNEAIDIGIYTEEIPFEYKFISDQYFKPERIDVSLYHRECVADNWVQNTLTGKKCMSLEQQNINISDYVDMDIREYLETLPQDDDDKTEILKVVLCMQKEIQNKNNKVNVNN